MPLDVTELVRPQHTAVVINECQVGILGESSSLPAIADEARWIIPNVARLVHAARGADATVMHTVAGRRPDGRGSRTGRMVQRHVRSEGPSLTPDEFSAVMPEIGFEESDFVVTRLGGVGGLSASGAVAILRNLGITTLVLGGVTLNAGVLASMIYALDEGFDTVVVSDASAGFPREYGEEVLLRTIRPFSPIATVEEIVSAWSAAPH